MTYTEVQSSDYVVNQGYRYATEVELIKLHDHAGGDGNYYNTTNGVPIAEIYNAATLLIELMGSTSDILGTECDQIDQDWHIGMFGPELITDFQTAAVVDAFDLPDSRAGTAANWLDYVETGPYPPRPRSDFGSYLVRPIPIPPALYLFASSLIGVIGMARAKTR